MKWYAPLDPNCPEVQDFHLRFWDDPITQTCGCADEIVEAWENKHRRNCSRCQDYGMENIDVR